MACKVLALGLALVAYLFVTPAIAFGLGLLAGKIFWEATPK